MTIFLIYACDTKDILFAINTAGYVLYVYAIERGD